MSSEVEVNGYILSNGQFTTDTIGPNSKCKAPIILKMTEDEEDKIKTIETIGLYIGFKGAIYDELGDGYKVETSRLKIK